MNESLPNRIINILSKRLNGSVDLLYFTSHHFFASNCFRFWIPGFQWFQTFNSTSLNYSDSLKLTRNRAITLLLCEMKVYFSNENHTFYASIKSQIFDLKALITEMNKSTKPWLSEQHNYPSLIDISFTIKVPCFSSEQVLRAAWILLLFSNEITSC